MPPKSRKRKSESQILATITKKRGRPRKSNEENNLKKSKNVSLSESKDNLDNENKSEIDCVDNVQGEKCFDSTNEVSNLKIIIMNKLL